MLAPPNMDGFKLSMALLLRCRRFAGCFAAVVSAHRYAAPGIALPPA